MKPCSTCRSKLSVKYSSQRLFINIGGGGCRGERVRGEEEEEEREGKALI